MLFRDLQNQLQINVKNAYGVSADSGRLNGDHWIYLWAHPESILFTGSLWWSLGVPESELADPLKVWKKYVHSDDIKKLINRQEMDNSSIYKFDEIIRFYTVDGDKRLILMRGAVCVDDSPTGLCGTYVDITNTLSDNAHLFSDEHGQAFCSEAIYEQNKFRDIKRMINALAHHWRQPLNEIMLICDFIRSEVSSSGENSDLEMYFEDHSKAVFMLSHIIDDFRNYFDVGNKKEKLNITKTVVETVMLLRQKLISENVHFVLRCACANSSFSWEIEEEHKYCNMNLDILSGSKIEFQQIFLNILSNAVDATKKAHLLNGVKKAVEVSVALNEIELCLSVKNTGQHIPQDILDAIYYPYFTTKSAVTDNGMGLFMSRVLIENQFKGTISVQNVDDGVEVRMMFPLLKNEEHEWDACQ